MPSWLRPSALMMPPVTVWPTPKGLPMASTWSPTCRVSELPSTTTGSRSRSICSRAKSVSGSVPMILARACRPSLRTTSISSALSTTWLLVRIRPLALTITPLPSPACGSLFWSPKKNLNQGSSLFGWRRAALLVLILTTAAEAVCAARRKLPGGTAPGAAAGASSTVKAP